MASPALSRPAIALLPSTEHPVIGGQFDEDCNQLLAHMLDCPLCLDPDEPTCPACARLQDKIRQHGEVKAGVVFAY